MILTREIFQISLILNTCIFVYFDQAFEPHFRALIVYLLTNLKKKKVAYLQVLEC